MKSLGLIMASAVLLSGAVSAAEYETFVGVGVSDGVMYNGGHQFEPNLRVGTVINDKHRLTGTYAYATDSKDSNIFASYDYLVSISDNQKWNWFIGGSAGYAVFKDAGNDWSLGAQTGVQYQINDKYSMEMGYRVIDTWDDWKDRNMSQLDSFYLAVDIKL
ncbi:hypothetical protein C9J03_13445 [Photobacterium gaetbulicola]|uniref:Uncharacterized protein n=1 Tax=Photobacterium gaetbulicola Gung47 TaxID=658445 RepID=A0A0C5WTJ6_9GAMM|nr:outer membrane beta-barrel protein [Photobacterium gaetbulicola]AJR06340.1 hypothetical protein H744_1c1317 [Photobacterium gaetbulicola Gung47]PSU08721.1 hypothetical protein C9J03_13445 [Photobacterium gaetbulicola]